MVKSCCPYSNIVSSSPKPSLAFIVKIWHIPLTLIYIVMASQPECLLLLDFLCSSSHCRDSRGDNSSQSVICRSFQMGHEKKKIMKNHLSATQNYRSLRGMASLLSSPSGRKERNVSGACCTFLFFFVPWTHALTCQCHWLSWVTVEASLLAMLCCVCQIGRSSWRLEQDLSSLLYLQPVSSSEWLSTVKSHQLTWPWSFNGGSVMWD